MKIQYRKEIDFLRAIAVLYVTAFHFFPKVFPKGYLGVDLFFVISGFLISLQIYNLIILKKFSLKDFYLRRIRRIFPAVIFLIIVTSIISFLLYTKNDLFLFSKSALFSIAFLANFHFWSIGGYFSVLDELKTLLHLWSLGVEEQFYIFFPILFLILLKFIKKINYLIIAFLLISLFSLSLNLFLKSIGQTNAAFFLLPTRVWNLGFGVLAMLFYVKNKKSHNDFIAALCLFFIVTSIFINNSGIPSDVILIISTALFLSKKLPKNFNLKNLIYNKYINYIGLISFSLYLWHWPILVFFKYYYVYEVTIFTKLVGLIIVFLFSIISFHFIEQTFRYKMSLKKFSLFLLAMFLSVTIFLTYNLISKKNINGDEKYYDTVSNSSYSNYKCKFENMINYFLLKACLLNNKSLDTKYKIALIGNSHAQMYAPSITPHLKEKSLQALLISNTGCLPTLTVNLSKSCMIRAKEHFEKYAIDKNIEIIILATTWSHDKIFDGEKYINNDPLIISKSLIDIINKLKNKNKKVFLIGPIQRPNYMFPQNLSRLIKFNHIEENQIESYLRINRTIYNNNYSKSIKLLKSELNNNFIDVSEILCNEKFCFFADENGSYFADDGHLSKYGASLVENKFEIVFK